VVIGSQAILGSSGEDELPLEAVFSMEADIAFRDDPDERLSDAVDAAIGEGSLFHSMYSYYAQGVSAGTATLPAGWESRAIAYERPDAEPSRAVCLERHDLVVSKLVAGREKDRDFATALIAAGLVDPATLHERAAELALPGGTIRRVRDSIDRCARRAIES